MKRIRVKVGDRVRFKDTITLPNIHEGSEKQPHVMRTGKIVGVYPYIAEVRYTVGVLGDQHILHRGIPVIDFEMPKISGVTIIE